MLCCAENTIRKIKSWNQFMKIRSLFAFFIFFCTMLQVNSQLPMVQPDEKTPIIPIFHDALTRGLIHVHNSRYSEALAIFDSLQQTFPNRPAPYFYKAATYQDWMLTFRFNKFQNDLYENAEIAIDKGNTILEKNSDPWINFSLEQLMAIKLYTVSDNIIGLQLILLEAKELKISTKL
jgi:hypothetical protein